MYSDIIDNIYSEIIKINLNYLKDKETWNLKHYTIFTQGTYGFNNVLSSIGVSYKKCKVDYMLRVYGNQENGYTRSNTN